MKFSILMAAGLPLVSQVMAAGVKDGHGEAELLAQSATYQTGKPVTVGIRLKVEDGWHAYWTNPGEGGMAMSAKWTLPEGWKAGALQAPVPKRFMTGELPGFGYEGEAVYLVDLTPPAGAGSGASTAECKVKLSWLTCDEKACVPGDVELAVKLAPGDGAPGKDAAALTAAAKKIPQPLQGAALKVEEADKALKLTITAPAGVDLDGAQAFPATEQVVDAADPLKFARSADGWTATAKKSEYATGAPTLLDIVLAGGKLERPLVVSWQAAKK
ncbi:protein-disulfide reductase DsbD domain-containing protein [Haloferula sp. BvORR071]|uniref:protein-disulfide reductase DsbD domain-containing protein n=1 Tax=Haloferula sp. BvORR071 TaxID=1396141 RepID=UPI002240FD4D|nr:protein-disulfide reductase DsbD domain-containing protein [Haloferula sp. BvORR071]